MRCICLFSIILIGCQIPKQPEPKAVIIFKFKIGGVVTGTPPPFTFIQIIK